MCEKRGLLGLQQIAFARHIVLLDLFLKTDSLPASLEKLMVSLEKSITSLRNLLSSLNSL